MPQRKRQKNENSQDESHKKILDAALTCFETNGFANTTMEDVAREAEVDRTTVYRAFPNRSALIDAVAILRINSLRDSIKTVVDGCSSLEDAVISGILWSVKHCRLDQKLMAAINATHDRGVEHYLIDPKSPMLENMKQVWHGVFTRARKSGELRKDIADTELSSWLLGVFLILLLREDLNAKGQRDWLTKFVIPGLKPESRPEK